MSHHSACDPPGRPHHGVLVPLRQQTKVMPRHVCLVSGVAAVEEIPFLGRQVAEVNHLTVNRRVVV
jgi:hypothetical protein